MAMAATIQSLAAAKKSSTADRPSDDAAEDRPVLHWREKDELANAFSHGPDSQRACALRP